MLINNPAGNFSFIKGIEPFSFGAVAHPGYEIVHVTFHPLPLLQQGFTLVERHLQSLQRPLQALCGMELRIPRPLSPQGFNEFNQPYIQQLASWKLLVDGLNSVARRPPTRAPRLSARGRTPVPVRPARPPDW
jgi:hypothetical protein